MYIDYELLLYILYCLDYLQYQLYIFYNYIFITYRNYKKCCNIYLFV